jgi:hypothetical protein
MGLRVRDHAKPLGEILPGQSANILDIYLAGNFVSTGSLTSYGSNTASEYLDYTFNGSSYSSSFAFETPEHPPVVPAPFSISILGMGLAGLGLARRRHG